MNIIILILQILGGIFLLAVVLTAVVLLLPAGIQASWQNGKAEIWISAGPLRRRFYPPRNQERPQKKTGPTEPAEPAGPSGQPDVPAKKAEPAADPAGKGNGPSALPSVQEPPPDEVDRLYDSIMSDPLKYVRRLGRWGKGPGKILLEHLKVRKVRIVWTVTAGDAAATAIAYGALAGACNTAWAILEDLVDIRADELRLEADFTGDRKKERCFSCQITARMYIIVASVILTVMRNAGRRSKTGKKRRVKAVTAT